MENPLRSSGIFSQDLRNWRSSRRSRTTCRIETLNPKSLKIESYSCQRSMTSNGHGEEIQRNVFKIPNKSTIARRDSREDAGHWPWKRKEIVWNSQLKTWRKMGFHRHTDCWTIHRNRSSSIQEHQCFKSWNSPKRKKNRDTIHFNTDVTNTELLFWTIHSANQLSIYGAVACWCEEFGLRANAREMTSEKFATKENEQLLKNEKPKEVKTVLWCTL